MEFTGDNIAELEKFTKRKVTLNPNTEIMPLATIWDNESPMLISKGDYIAKHGKGLIVVTEEIYKFLSK